jgi:response regulator of citrate/malate metabolism
MDDYLAKPVNLGKLRDMLAKWTAPQQAAGEGASTPTPAP